MQLAQVLLLRLLPGPLPEPLLVQPPPLLLVPGPLPDWALLEPVKRQLSMQRLARLPVLRRPRSRTLRSQLMEARLKLGMQPLPWRRRRCLLICLQQPGRQRAPLWIPWSKACRQRLPSTWRSCRATIVPLGEHRTRFSDPELKGA